MTAPVPPDFQRIAEPLAWWAAHHPNHTALIEAGVVWTYGQLDQAVTAAQGSLADHGVRPGDRVAIIGENSIALVALILAASRAGAWVVPLNPRLSDREVDEITEHATPRRTLFITQGSAKTRQQARRHATEPFALAELAGIEIGASNPRANAATDADVAALIYTSGTTGQPKGVMLTHRNLLFSARTSGQIRALTPHDLIASVLPISHILGFTGVMLASLTWGATLTLMARFDPPRLLRLVLGEPVTVMLGAPSMFALLAEYATQQGMSVLPAHRLRLISSAGAPLDDGVKAAVEACFGIVLNNGYGITECAPTIALTRLERPRRDCSVGVLLPGVEARLDGDGALHIRGPNVMAGYYRDEAATARVLDADGWFNTGDLARVEDDHWYIVGRTKEQISRFGFKIYPAEVEAVLNAYPGVRQSAVIGRGDGAHQDVIAFVEAAADALSVADLADYAAARLADYKRPAEIRVMAALPMGATGKVLKSALMA
ncbi:class I adenylate-forming enzyme family protein [Acidiphilium sp.]|uniref:class I adenylate-forming enzyme family protein n=1 Tax=Acidiphilium sp. TaxID=527 RepID=UPI003D0662AE